MNWSKVLLVGFLFIILDDWNTGRGLNVITNAAAHEVAEDEVYRGGDESTEVTDNSDDDDGADTQWDNEAEEDEKKNRKASSDALPHRQPPQYSSSSSNTIPLSRYERINGLIINHYFEVFGLFFAIFYCTVMWIGKRKNENLALTLYRIIRAPMEKEWCHIGLGTPSAPDTKILQESWDEFLIYASGRHNAAYCRIHLILSKRQDFISTLLFPSNDIMNIEISLDQPQGLFPCPTIFAMIRKNLAKSFLETRERDIQQFAKLRKIQNTNTSGGGAMAQSSELNEQYVIYSDSGECLETFLGTSFIQSIAKMRNVLQYIYVSDIAMGQQISTNAGNDPSKQPQRVVILQCKVPQSLDPDIIQSALTLACAYTDATTSLHLSEKTRTNIREKRAEAERARKKIEDAEKAAELAQKKAAEKKRLKDEAFDKMTPDQQRRAEDKEKKKTLKNRMQGRMKVVKM